MIARTLFLIALIPTFSQAQENRPNGEGPPDAGIVELKATQPDAPAGSEVARPGIARGKVVPFKYE